MGRRLRAMGTLLGDFVVWGLCSASLIFLAVLSLFLWPFPGDQSVVFEEREASPDGGYVVVIATALGGGAIAPYCSSDIYI